MVWVVFSDVCIQEYLKIYEKTFVTRQFLVEGQVVNAGISARLAVEVMFPDHEMQTSEEIQMKTAVKLKECEGVYCRVIMLILETKQTLYKHPITGGIIRAITWNMQRCKNRITQLSQCALMLTEATRTNTFKAMYDFFWNGTDEYAQVLRVVYRQIDMFGLVHFDHLVFSPLQMKPPKEEFKHKANYKGGERIPYYEHIGTISQLLNSIKNSEVNGIQKLFQGIGHQTGLKKIADQLTDNSNVMFPTLSLERGLFVCCGSYAYTHLRACIEEVMRKWRREAARWDAGAGNKNSRQMELFLEHSERLLKSSFLGLSSHAAHHKQTIADLFEWDASYITPGTYASENEAWAELCGPDPYDPYSSRLYDAFQDQLPNRFWLDENDKRGLTFHSTYERDGVVVPAADTVCVIDLTAGIDSTTTRQPKVNRPVVSEINRVDYTKYMFDEKNNPVYRIGAAQFLGNRANVTQAYTISRSKTYLADAKQQILHYNDSGVICPVDPNTRRFLVDDQGDLFTQANGRSMTFDANTKLRSGPITGDMSGIESHGAHWKDLCPFMKNHPGLDVIVKILSYQWSDAELQMNTAVKEDDIPISTIAHFFAFARGMHLYDNNQGVRAEKFTVVHGLGGVGKSMITSGFILRTLGERVFNYRTNQGNSFSGTEMNTKFWVWLLEEADSEKSKSSLLPMETILRQCSSVPTTNAIKHVQHMETAVPRATILAVTNKTPADFLGMDADHMDAFYRRMIAFFLSKKVDKSKQDESLESQIKMDDPTMIILASEFWQLLGVVGKFKVDNGRIQSISCKGTAWFDSKVSKWSNVGTGYWLFDVVEFILEDEPGGCVALVDVAAKIKSMAKNLSIEPLNEQQQNDIQKLNKNKISEMLYSFANDTDNFSLISLQDPSNRADSVWKKKGFKNKRIREMGLTGEGGAYGQTTTLVE